MVSEVRVWWAAVGVAREILAYNSGVQETDILVEQTGRELLSRQAACVSFIFLHFQSNSASPFLYR